MEIHVRQIDIFHKHETEPVLVMAGFHEDKRGDWFYLKIGGVEQFLSVAQFQQVVAEVIAAAHQANAGHAGELIPITEHYFNRHQPSAEELEENAPTPQEEISAAARQCGLDHYLPQPVAQALAAAVPDECGGLLHAEELVTQAAPEANPVIAVTISGGTWYATLKDGTRRRATDEEINEVVPF